MTCYTAIFGAYDDLKEPTVITEGWKYVCFTDQPFRSNVWEIRLMPPPPDPHMMARKIKILFHRFIEDEYSLWVDGSFKINCDLNIWWERFKEPFTALKHPIRDCVYEEGQTCIEQGRDAENVKRQIEAYRKAGLPENNGLIQSGLLMRKKTPEVIDLCEKWFLQVQIFSLRDQVGFCMASWKNPIHSVTEWDYRTQQEFMFTKHKKRIYGTHNATQDRELGNARQ